MLMKSSSEELPYQQQNIILKDSKTNTLERQLNIMKKTFIIEAYGMILTFVIHIIGSLNHASLKATDLHARFVEASSRIIALAYVFYQFVIKN